MSGGGPGFRSVLAFDPGVRTGVALLSPRCLVVTTLALSRDYAEAVRQLDGFVRPLLGYADEIYAEDWVYQRGRAIADGYKVPMALLGYLASLGAHMVSPRVWKASMAPRIPARATRYIPEGGRIPPGLAPNDRGLWLALETRGFKPLLDSIRRMPKKDRPHALDALGLAVYARLLASEREEVVARGV